MGYDFYDGSIERVRAQIKSLTSHNQELVYLSSAGPVELTPETCLLGHDG